MLYIFLLKIIINNIINNLSITSICFYYILIKLTYIYQYLNKQVFIVNLLLITRETIDKDFLIK